jgi:hypothetical protein
MLRVNWNLVLFVLSLEIKEEAPHDVLPHGEASFSCVFTIGVMK